METTQTEPAVRTFLIADVRGYTRFTRERGDAAAALLAKRFADLARDAVEARGGNVLELRGDEALAVFESPAQAVRAALEFQATCAEESEADPAFPLPVGIGIDAGEAIPVEDGFRGVALNMAARLCSNAAAGQVLVTRTIVETAGSLDGEVTFVERGPASFKGFEQAVDVIEAVAGELPPEAEPASAEGLAIPPELDPMTPLVDREHELRWLRGTWRQVRRGHGRVLFVSGPAQIGKTRLAAEMAAHVHGDGGFVRYAGPGGAAAAIALSSLRESLEASTTTLLVLDDVDVAGPGVAEALARSFAEIAGKPLLVLALVRDPEAEPELTAAIELADERGDGHRALSPFGLDGVRGIVELYAGEHAAEVPVESMARASGGVPGRVHEVASEWAGSEASRRLAAAAEFLAAGRDRHSSDLEFANNVIGLKLGRLFTVEGRDVLAVETCPYKGLAAFGEDDSSYFFGRERLVGELAARTVQTGLLGVIGASGSGKSSAVAAGLLPSLKAGLLPGSQQWTHATMRPGEHPMRELRSTLGTEGTDPLAEAAARVGDGGRLVLVVDQFEETFTTCASEEERVEFIDSLTKAARAPERVVVIPAIRGDYYAHCAPYPELAELLAANHVLVGPLTREELRRAIELPARRAGLRIESALVDALVEEVADEPGGLPLLSTALVELWQARDGGWIRMEAYERTGGVRGAVARLAESAYEQLTDAEQDAARRIFLRLVATGEGDAVTKRRVDLDELDLDRDPTTAAVLTRLTQDRLLTMSEDTVEVAHEALLREWPRLQTWLEEDAQGRQLRQHLTQASKQWEGRNREPSELYRGARLSATLDWSADHASEMNELEREFLTASRQAGEQESERQRRTNRRLRGLLVGTAVFLIVALVAGALALVQRGTARRSARDAEHSAQQAKRSATAALAQSLGSQSLVAKAPSLSLLLARQAVALQDNRQTEGTLLTTLQRWDGIVRVLRPSPKRLLRIAVSADGDLVAISDNSSHVFVYDTRSFERVTVIHRFADAMIFAPTGDDLYVTTADTPAPIEAFDASTGKRIWRSHGRSGMSGFAVSPDGKLIAHADDPSKNTPQGPQPLPRPHTLTILHAADGSPALRPLEIDDFKGVAFLGQYDVVVSKGTKNEIIDVRTGRVVGSIAAPHERGGGAITLAATSDGSKVAFGLQGGNVELLDRTTGKRRILSAPSPFEITVMKFSPDGRTLGATAPNGVVVTWDVTSGTAHSWQGQTGNVNDLSFTADGHTMWTDGLDGTAVEWDIAGDRTLRRVFDAGYPSVLDSLPYSTWSPTGRQVAVTASDHRTVFLNAHTLRLIGRLPKNSFECCMPPAYSGDGKLLVTVDAFGVDLWDATKRTKIRRLYSSDVKPSPDAPPVVDADAITPDGSLVAANENDTVLLLDTETGKIERKLDAGWYVGTLAFSMNGRLLAAGGGSLTGKKQYTKVWDVRTGKRLWTHEVLSQSSLAAFSPDDRLYAVGTSEGRVFVFDAHTGEAVGSPYIGDAGFVFSVTFDPSTGLLASTGTDGVATLSDPETGATFGSPLVAAGDAWSTGAWSPDGSTYALLAGNGKGYVWDMSRSSWRRRACAMAGRSLSRSEWKQFLPGRAYDPAC